MSLVFGTVCYGQTKNVIGVFSNGIAVPKLVVTFKPDSTFEYVSTEHPTFYRWEDFSENGKWTVHGDTIILNPQLEAKPFVQSDFQEQDVKGNTAFLLTFNHVKRYYDRSGNLTKSDTVQIVRVDYAFNELKKKNLIRVAQRPTTRCVFAGYIPKEIITDSRTVPVPKPTEELKSIFIGCYELQGTTEFVIKNPNSNRLTLNVYSNYYLDGQIRQKKLLIKNENILYTRQKLNGKFEKDNIWSETDAKLKRQKGGR
jgi:hypothetical protein